MPVDYTNKLPKKLIKVINENKKNNEFIYDKNKPLHEQNILKDTRVFLSLLYRVYWCSK